MLSTRVTEINGKYINYNRKTKKTLWLFDMSADNVLGREMVLRISHLSSKLRLSGKYEFFGQYLSRRCYQPTYQLPKGLKGFTCYLFYTLCTTLGRYLFSLREMAPELFRGIGQLSNVLAFRCICSINK